MNNPLKWTERHNLGYFSWKWYITISLVLFSLISCSNVLISKREIPKKIKYSKIQFVNCDSVENQSYLCITRQDAEKSVIDLKKCQEQNDLMRELLNGN
jgi:hypothetical protein